MMFVDRVTYGFSQNMTVDRAYGDREVRGVGSSEPKLTPHQQREALERLAQDETQRSVARSYNVSQATISRLRA
jgi:hypothetical protein